MFQPHSVRGLLSRRNVSRIQEDPADLQSNGDPDLESMVEAKLFIKDIDHQIDDIRQWRDHQRTLLNQQLASNKTVADTLIHSYLGNIEQQEQRDVQEQIKILRKLNNVEYGEEPQQIIKDKGDTNLFDFVASSNKLVEERRYQADTEGNSMLAEQTLASQVEEMGEIVLRTRDTPSTSSKALDRDQLRRELEQIDAELRQAEQLLKD